LGDAVQATAASKVSPTLRASWEINQAGYFTSLGLYPYQALFIMAAPNDQRIAVPIDDPNADTEWFVLCPSSSIAGS
jgi:hypothetical protein